MNENTNSEYYLLVEDGSNPEIEYRNPDYMLSRSLNLYRHIILPDDYQVIDLYLMGRVSKLKVDSCLLIYNDWFRVNHSFHNTGLLVGFIVHFYI